jgi:large subunit ribosomal protein L22
MTAISKATLRHLRSSPQKVRLVVDQIRGKKVERALEVLRFSPKAVSEDLEKLLKSAIANAEQREERVDVDDLVVRAARVDAGPTQKRVRFRAMGRVFRILKRSSHVTLELDLTRGGEATEVAPVMPPPGREKAIPAGGAKKKTTKKVRKAGTKKKTVKKAKKAANKKKSTKKPAK